MSKTKSWNKITLEDILRLDSFDQQIYIHDAKSNKSEPMLPTNRAFFTQVYTDTSHNEIGIIDGSHQIYRVIGIEDWLTEIDQTENSLVILIEGYAGCGKSTFVQYVLSKQLGTYNYDYYYYNYDIGAYYENKKSHRIVAAIRECFVKQLKNHIIGGKIQIINKFEELLSQEEIKYLDFTYEIYNIFLDPDTDTFHKSIKNLLEKNDVKNFRITMNKLLNEFSCEQIMALDCLVRIAAYIESSNHSDSLLYICYDNLDSIENFNELNIFDNTLVSLRKNIDDYINHTISNNFKGMPIPRFVFMATYRKITAAKVGLTAHCSERIDDYSEYNKYIYCIDASHIYSYHKIISKRQEFYFDFIRKYNFSENKLKEQLCLVNQLMHTEFVQKKFAGLWNNNYRTCSSILDRIFSQYYEDAKKCIDLLNKKIDGYDEENASYYGASAIFIHLVCRVFHESGLWGDKHMRLIPLNPNKAAEDREISDLSSLSRLILTYISNSVDEDGYNRPISTQEIFREFDDLFSPSDICRSLANMLARDKTDTWRRPIYYYQNAINDDESIEKSLRKQWNANHNELIDDDSIYTQLLLCECGYAFVERLTSEFEFFSNRVDINSIPLYLLKNLDDIERTIKNVYKAVEESCLGMLQFCNLYMKKKGITNYKDYINLPIHPSTRNGNPQIYTERIIFSHISYLNQCRIYHINQQIELENKKEINNVFVDYINNYLDLYFKKIKPIDSTRLKMAKQLKDIVNDIKKAENNSKKLFQSISSNCTPTS